MAQSLKVARIQDAAAWASLSALLLLAPVTKAYDLLGLTRPQPSGAFVAAGLVLLAVSALLAARGGAGAVTAAATADAVAALAILAWMLADSPATRTRGTVVLALIVVSLAMQAAFDLAMLRQAGPAVERTSDRASKR